MMLKCLKKHVMSHISFAITEINLNKKFTKAPNFVVKLAVIVVKNKSEINTKKLPKYNKKIFFLYYYQLPWIFFPSANYSKPLNIGSRSLLAYLNLFRFGLFSAYSPLRTKPSLTRFFKFYFVISLPPQMTHLHKNN